MRRGGHEIPVAACVLVALMSGCMFGADYRRPVVAEESKFHQQAEVPVDAQSLADLPWWELFKDPQLQTHIRVALDGNKDLLLTAARVDEARARVGIVRSDLFPQIGATAEGSSQRIPGTLIPGVTQDTSLQSEIYSLRGAVSSWELDVWGRLRRATEAARAELMASEQVRQGIVLGLVANVAQAYFNLTELDLELEITGLALESRKKYLRIVDDRHKDGLVSGLDVTKAEAEVARLSARVPDLERQVAQQEHAFSLLLGRNPEQTTRGSSLTEQRVPPVIPAGLPSSLLERRPDIQEAEQILVAANAEVGAAKTLFLPQISLTGQFGAISRDLSDLFTKSAQIWSVGPSVTLPIFTAGKLHANLEATEARKQQALIRYQQAIQQAFREVDDALVAHQKARDARQYLDKLVASNRKALDLAEFRYEDGLSDYIDVLDAQRQLYDAEIDSARTQLAQLVSVVQLYKALGGGWQSQIVQQASASGG